MGKSPGEDYLDVLKARRKEKRPPNREQALAEEILENSGKKIKVQKTVRHHHPDQNPGSVPS